MSSLSCISIKPDNHDICVICRSLLYSQDERGEIQRVFAHAGDGKKHPYHEVCWRDIGLSADNTKILCPYCREIVDASYLFSRKERVNFFINKLAKTAASINRASQGLLEGLFAALSPDVLEVTGLIGSIAGVIAGGVGITAKTAAVAGVSIIGIAAISLRIGATELGPPAAVTGLGAGLGITVTAAGAITYAIVKYRAIA